MIPALGVLLHNDGERGVTSGILLLIVVTSLEAGRVRIEVTHYMNPASDLRILPFTPHEA